jgi:hypothetical protein
MNTLIAVRRCWFALGCLGSIVAACAQTAAPAAPASSTDNDARAASVGRAYLRYQEQLRQIAATTRENPEWWKAPVGQTITAVDSREKLLQAQREFNEAIRELLGREPLPATGPDARYGFLPEAKQPRVLQIEQLHGERLNELRRDNANIRLPADVARTKELAAQRERDLLAILTPAEFELLEMRTSASANQLRQRFGEAIESEEEFKKLFVLQKAFDDKFPIEDALYSSRQQETMRLRSVAERTLFDDMATAIGAERFAALRRNMDQDYQAARAVVRRLNLPATVTDAVMAMRENYANQTMTINAEAAMNTMDRRALIQELAKDAKKELTDALTPAGFEVYAGRSQWLRYLEQGMAFSTNPKDASSGVSSVTQTVFMVMPGSAMPVSARPAPAAVAPAANAKGPGVVRPAPAAGAKASDAPPAPAKSP